MAISLKKITQIVDDLAAAKKNIAEAEKIKKPLEITLKDMGVGTYIGTLHEAVVYNRPTTSIDWQAIAQELGFSGDDAKGKRLLKKYTSKGNSVCINVNARKQQV